MQILRENAKQQSANSFLEVLVAANLYNALLAAVLNDQRGELATLDAPGVKALGVFSDVETLFGVVSVYDSHCL